MESARGLRVGDIAAKHASVSVEDSPHTALANLALVVVLTTNLISNRAKVYVDRRSAQIHVSTEEIPADQATANVPDAHSRTFVRRSVRDNRIGIVPKNLGKVFGVFERLGAAKDYPGSGLGLASVKKGTERVGGVLASTRNRVREARSAVNCPRRLKNEDGCRARSIVRSRSIFFHTDPFAFISQRLSLEPLRLCSPKSYE